MAAYDLKRELKALYAPRNTGWELVDVPEQRFIAVDGRGDPNTSEAYARAVEALYAVAYTLKFAAKRDGADFVVAPLEGLWWSDSPEDFVTRDKGSWQWTMMICQPAHVSAEAIEDAKTAALAKRGLPAVERVRHRALHEGRCAQVLHVGSYDDEGPILAELHERYMPDNGFRFNGHHHEIYLSDPRKTEAARLRTVLRQPVADA
ncbi:GyrI-like domain-containing protein [Glycomyces arizonensis]|uniref:GyrI-like domain-containing protein n=1 Tax=Glycomyces arizonensis TaxID=256035 RepID=UPI000410B98A|nr:GyrI-like domain-containing protein [Glycomyces arizonensis]